MRNDILMVDDDKDLNEIVKMYLEDKEMNVRTVTQGIMFRKAFQEKKPDLIILDIDLPGTDGFQLCQYVRETSQNIPIIFLTNYHQESHRIQSFELGADDFMAKPFSLEELRLRIIARLKDKHMFWQQKVLHFGNFVLDLQSETLTKDQKSVQLTSIEMDIFRLLASHSDQIYSEKDIYEEVWKDNYNQDTRMVNVHISNLRKKIEKLDCTNKYIQTQWGKGYKYVG
ncbi:response regulator transcription factor [Candidatus Stoquefichus massiliensis]|uniref:response regulator transcription factor n=1 Tax=Candidatus Stoquefichus massiliensis TaxID=1470350 RepID=UPI0004ADDBAC|nr:response regulator transcription factor [Candidatus Stoquefichus massiliensis]